MSVWIFLGPGLGYGPLEAIARFGPENMLIWIENDARLLRTAVEWIDLTEVLDHPGTRLFVAMESREIHEALRAEITRILTGSVAIIAHPPSLQRDARYREHSRAIQDFAREGSVNVRTTFFLTRHSSRNQAGNLGEYLKSPGIKFLRGALEGEPAVLIAAGPSLRRNLHRLRELEGRVTTIAVSTALRPVLQAGLRPDFTALIDYHRVSMRYFEGLDPALEIPMVCDPKSAPDAVSAHTGPVLFSNDLIVNTLFEGIFGDLGPVAQGSTVAHLAFRFLAYLGADPIVLIGQDLAYPGGLIHVPGTVIQAQDFPSSHRFYSLETRELEYYFSHRKKFRRVPGVLGGEVPTDEIFFTYLQEFERVFADHPGRIINASGGASIAGTEARSLQEVVAEFGDRRCPDFRS
ncbi:MAG: motility associated factor glycosyltransferase family protein, partial [Planctomycetes bacterium]|nr:motility associated factor glycosyltransferase family protein [Planctomycetota bacterium]